MTMVIVGKEASERDDTQAIRNCRLQPFSWKLYELCNYPDTHKYFEYSQGRQSVHDVVVKQTYERREQWSNWMRVAQEHYKAMQAYDKEHGGRIV